MTPPENALILSVDEKSQIPNLATQPAEASATPRTAHERILLHGTLSLFAALDVKKGKVLQTPRCTVPPFLAFLKEIEKHIVDEVSKA